jgi:hypothetical protein
MKNVFIALVMGLVIGSGTGLFAQTALLRELTGTVEIKAPGSAVWAPAKAGMAIDRAASISTGFKSTALIALGNSVVTVRPLTRLTLEELVTNQDGNEQVAVYLRTGKVRAEVTPPSGRKTDFTVKSPSATASVRGTVFEFDTTQLNVIEGRVQFQSSSGSLASVRAGEASAVNETSAALTSPREEATGAFAPELPAGLDKGKTGVSVPVQGEDLSGNLGSEIKWKSGQRQ